VLNGNKDQLFKLTLKRSSGYDVFANSVLLASAYNGPA